MMIPRFCVDDGQALVAMGRCPIHGLWPLIKRSYLHGERLRGSLDNRNIDRISKGSLSSTGVEAANSYPTKAFRRDAAANIMSSGSTIAHITRPSGGIRRVFALIQPSRW